MRTARFYYFLFVLAVSDVSAQPPEVPAVPSGFRVLELTYKFIRIAWDPISNADGYQIATAWDTNASAAYGDCWGRNCTEASALAPPGINVWFAVRAMNGAGASPFSDWFKVTTPLQPAAEGQATLSGSYHAGGTAWPTYFGSDGYWIAYGDKTIPSYATIASEHMIPHWWGDPTGDPREILQRSTETNRVVAAFYEANLGFDLEIECDAPKPVTLYFLDWHRLGMRQTIEIIDLASDRILDTRSIAGFEDGLYLTYYVRGNVQFRMRLVSIDHWSNASGSTVSPVFSALLFGKTAAPPSQSLGLSIEQSLGAPKLAIHGRQGNFYVLQRSLDLKNWTEVSRGLLSADTHDLTPEMPADAQFAWFRSVQGEATP